MASQNIGVSQNSGWNIGVSQTEPSGSHNYTQTFTETITTSDSITERDIKIPLSDSLSITDGITKSSSRNLSDSITVSDTMVKGISRGFAEAGITLTDSIARSIGKSVSDALTLSDLIGKAVTINLSDVITTTDNIQVSGLQNTYIVCSATNPDILDWYVNGEIVGRMDIA